MRPLRSLQWAHRVPERVFQVRTRGLSFIHDNNALRLPCKRGAGIDFRSQLREELRAPVRSSRFNLTAATPAIANARLLLCTFVGSDISNCELNLVLGDCQSAQLSYNIGKNA